MRYTYIVSFLGTKKILALWAKYERPASTVSLIVGFSFDLIVAKRPDSVYDNLLLLAYLCIAATCIVVLNRRSSRPRKVEGIARPEAEPLALLLVLQFCFGGLSSNLLVLYGHSGTVSGTALFIGILVALLVGNEFLRSRYDELRFNLAVYDILLLTYVTVAAPTFLFHAVGTWPFLGSIAIAAAAMAFFIFILSGSARLFRGKVGRGRIMQSSIIVAAVFVVFGALYFARLIPPVPLSLKAIGIYHSVVHDASGYHASFEPAPWFEFWRDTSGTYHTEEGGNAYCFSSVFAPTGLTTPVVHEWDWYDKTSGAWVPQAKVAFPIAGGRSGGYYGYSIKALGEPGQWRCDVETKGGILIGRTTFTVAFSPAPALQQKTL